jgi:hypothetical protein
MESILCDIAKQVRFEGGLMPLMCVIWPGSEARLGNWKPRECEKYRLGIMMYH